MPPVEEALLAVLGSGLAGAGYWVRGALLTRGGRKKSERDNARALSAELKGLLDHHRRGNDLPMGNWQAVKRIVADAGLLHDKKLRERVLLDCRLIEGWSSVREHATGLEVVRTFVDDAAGSLAAAARGDRLPGMSDEAARLLLVYANEAPSLIAPEEAAAVLRRHGTTSGS